MPDYLVTVTIVTRRTFSQRADDLPDAIERVRLDHHVLRVLDSTRTFPPYTEVTVSRSIVAVSEDRARKELESDGRSH